MMVPLSRRALGRLVALAALAGLPAVALAAEPVFPPASSIGLVPPPGMTPAQGFSGFEHRSGASIVIMEMPAEAYAEISRKFTPEALRPTGFSVKGEGEPLAVTGGEGRLLRGAQAAHGLTYAKWVAVVRGGAGTGLVTVQVPEQAAAQVPGEAVEAALRSIAFRTPASLDDQIAALPYTIGDRAGFRPVRVLLGNSLLLTEGPKDVDPGRTQPMIIIAPSLGQAAVGAGQEGAFARKALGSLRDLKDVAVTDETRSTRGTNAVVRLRATATDLKTGRPLAVTQTMLFDGPRYLRVIGMAEAGEADAIDRAERVAASITTK
ncbi:hypothetical protein [Methylobacterium oryzisoli]|uniref:hypothetical protein n=1 Tax=Methylobacterium oryzisoli TaxID=3385502 RepID=UPI003891632E